MNHGPLIFLGAFLALAASWFGFVLTPQLQLGQLQQTNTVPGSVTYPLARSGLARQGLDVYRANGCVYCHSQQLGQTGTLCEVVLTDAGTNQPALVVALLKLDTALTDVQARQLLRKLPQTILKSPRREVADAALKSLAVGGAKSQVAIRPVGPDMAGGWGVRRTVAEDYLYDSPVQPGSRRVGPDLSNVSLRRPDAHWQLLHLYSPQHAVPGSVMPPYRYLFEKRRIERVRSPESLDLPEALQPEKGYEIVPRPEAVALAAYLLSLRADAPLFDAPVTLVAAAPASVQTNAPAK